MNASQFIEKLKKVAVSKEIQQNPRNYPQFCTRRAERVEMELPRVEFQWGFLQCKCLQKHVGLNFFQGASISDRAAFLTEGWNPKNPIP